MTGEQSGWRAFEVDAAFLYVGAWSVPWGRDAQDPFWLMGAFPDGTDGAPPFLARARGMQRR